MKRALIIFLLLFLIMPLSIAQENTSSNQTTFPQLNQTQLDEAKNLASTQVQKIDETLEKERPIPENLQLLSKILFGLETTLTASFFIILLMMWLIILLILVEALQMSNIFNGPISWPIAIIVNLLFGVSGVFREVTAFYMGFGEAIAFIGRWPIVTLIFSIIVLAIIGFVILTSLKHFKKKAEEEQAPMSGFESGVLKGLMKKMFDAWK
jgi:hypothetical protein